MAPEDPRTASEHFRVHYQRGSERSVDGCVSLGQAVAQAGRSLDVDSSLRICITDAVNRLLLDEDDVRMWCEQ